MHIYPTLGSKSGSKIYALPVSVDKLGLFFDATEECVSSSYQFHFDYCNVLNL